MKNEKIMTYRKLLNELAFVKEPELLTVRTISPKIFDQLEYFDGRAGSEYGRKNFDGCEIIGQHDYCVIVRDERGRIGRIRGTAFIMWMINHKGATSDDANEAIRNLPQLFAA